ncbi:hypothetical protein FG91_03569 [Sphingopyxis sp. LC81]|nr:hypothetical protein FG91_03569 [Sphingopyxis sp. LC81]
MGGRRLLRGIEPVHLGQIGHDVLRHRGRHRRVDDVGRFLVAAVHREDHRAQAPGAAVLRAQLRRQQRYRAIGIAADPERQRIAPRQFVVGRDRQRELVIALRRVLLSQQIAREAAVGEEQPLGRAHQLRFAEIVERARRIFHMDHRRTECGLDRAVARARLFGADKEAERGAIILQLDRRAAGIEQRGRVAVVRRDARE